MPNKKIANKTAPKKTRQKKSNEIVLTRKDVERMLKFLEQTGRSEVVIDLKHRGLVNRTTVVGPYCSDVC